MSQYVHHTLEETIDSKGCPALLGILELVDQTEVIGQDVIKAQILKR